MDLLIDFETYCEANLKEVGVRRYVTDPSFKVLCMYYKPFDPVTMIGQPTKGWTFQNPHEVLDLPNYDNYWALNTGFDLNVYLTLRHNILLNKNLNKWKDVQGILSKFSLPQSLEDAANVLNSPIKKHPDGNLIINRCCKKNANLPSQEDYQKLFDYCEQDVDATFEVMKACPSTKVSDYEWDLWRETFKMNYRGLPIQWDAVQAIKTRVDAFKEVICESLPDLTGGLITKPTQTARIKNYLNSHGVKVENTTADTLEKLMDKHEREPFLPNDCFQLIQARQAGGASSVAKFDKLLDMRVGDKVHDFLRYGATNTQRWTGAGYQVHSLPRKNVKDPEQLIRDFLEFNDIDNPMQMAKALCRSVIKAPPGQMIYNGDYSSIEYLLLIWMTDMFKMLERFKSKKKAYIDMAAYLFKKKYEDINEHPDDPDDLEYFLGKQVILGCGYQMGAKKFQATCEKYNVDIDFDMASYAVKGYRQMYKPIKKMWDNVHTCCIAAIQYPGTEYKAAKCKFVVLPDKHGTGWLIITLPSSTKLYYHSPRLSNGKYGPEIKHMGIQNYKWISRYLSPGRITENIVQKLARDLMAYSIYQMSEESRFKMLMTVHDELNSLGPAIDPERHLKLYLSILERTPTWAKTIPLRAGGYYGPRYKKD